MITRLHVRFLLVLLSCILLLGAVSRASETLNGLSFEYPRSWPRKINSTDCSHISGEYQSSGKAFERTFNPLFLDSRIERVLMRGTYGGKVKSVRLHYMVDTDTLDITYYGEHLQSKKDYGKVRPKYKSELHFKVEGICNKDGQFVIHYTRPWGGSGESYPTKSEATSLLSTAKDGSLIVKYVSKIWISKWFGLSIEKSKSIGWYKYLRKKRTNG